MLTHICIGLLSECDLNFISCGLSAEMVVPDVDKNILEELEAMGFPKARATRALHYSGKTLACHVLLFFSFSCGLWAPVIVFGKPYFTQFSYPVKYSYA